MANTDKPFGFKPVQHQSGAPYNGQVNIYSVATNEGTAIWIGDLVKMNGGGLNTYGSVTRWVSYAVDGAPVGVVVGVVPSGVDSVSGKMTNGASPTLDTPQYIPATPGVVRYVLVADDPGLIFEVQADDDTSTITHTYINLNFAVVATAGSTVTGMSLMELDSNTGATTNTLPLQLVGFPNRVDNEVGSTNQNCLVRLNMHAKSGGATGVQGA